MQVKKQKKKRSSEVDTDRLAIDLIDWNDPKDDPKNLRNFEAGSLEQPSLLRLVPIGLLTGSVDNEEAVKGEKSKTESDVTESVNDGKLSELIKIVSSHGYSRVTHTVRRSTDHNQVLGYALLKDNTVMDDPEDFYLLSVKATNYGKARPDNVIKNLMSDSDI